MNVKYSSRLSIERPLITSKEIEKPVKRPVIAEIKVLVLQVCDTYSISIRKGIDKINPADPAIIACIADDEMRKRAGIAVLSTMNNRRKKSII